MSKIFLYHTGFYEIKEPDIHYGKPNADFAQGFYTSPDLEFSKRWARERKGADTILNTYELDTDGLKIKRFQRSRNWFEYIFKNRAGFEDSLKEYDIITGPIANDTIYDTWGIITSGLLEKDVALKLLKMGNEYQQTAIKSEKAASQLKWIKSEILRSEDIVAFRKTVVKEEAEYQRLVAEHLDRLTEFLE